MIKKVKYSYFNERKEVTGLVINKHLNVPREFYYNTRAMIYNGYNNLYQEALKYIEKFPHKSLYKLNHLTEEKVISRYKSVIEGRVRYIGFILGKDNYKYLKLAKDYNNMVQREVFDIRKNTDPFEWLEKHIYVIEVFNYTECAQGTVVYLGKGVFYNCGP